LNLVIDIGNSLTKISVFNNGEIVHLKKIESADFAVFTREIKSVCEKSIVLNNVIVSSVKNIDINFDKFLINSFISYIKVDDKTQIPIKNYYKTPKTLGKDRLVALVAANNIFPNTNVLIFDAGTALTIDFINAKKEYFGGNISPGITMRFKALNYFTDKLPLIDNYSFFYDEMGSDTNNAIISGVLRGIVSEVLGYIDSFKEKYPDLKIIFTGGDTFFFENILKRDIFADPDLVIKGLNRILEYNAENNY